MHSYQHNIKTFSHATRHLTRVERSLYRDLIELYYDTEQPLPADNFERLCRLVLAHTDEEKTALKLVLDEFFVLTGGVYSHDYCDEQIEKYKAGTSAKSRAGVMSAEARRKRSEHRKKARATQPEQPLNTCSSPVANHKPEPVTSNHSFLPAVADAKAVALFSDDDVKLARFIYQRVLAVQPKAKEPNFDKWANTIRLMREQDKRSHKQIQDAFLWANKDNFWKANIMSPDSLRRQLDKLEVQMQNKGKPSGNKSMADRMADATYGPLLDTGGLP